MWKWRHVDERVEHDEVRGATETRAHAAECWLALWLPGLCALVAWAVCALTAFDSMPSPTRMIVAIPTAAGLLVAVMLAAFRLGPSLSRQARAQRALAAECRNLLSSESELHRHHHYLKKMFEDRSAELERTNLLLARKVAESSRAAEAARWNEERLSLALASAPAGTWSYDIPTRRMWWDVHTEEIYGVAAGAFNGNLESWCALVHPDDLAGALEMLDSVEDDDSRCDAEFRVRTDADEWRHVHATGLILRDDGGTATQISGFCMDVSDRKRGELALKEMNEILERKVTVRTRELAHSNRELERFANLASHDLQEPLRMVASYVQLLERRYGPQLDDTAREFIKFAVEGTLRMKRLVSDLLEFAKVGGDPDTGPSDGDKVMETVLADLSIAIAESDARITYESLPVVPMGETELAQILRNLLENAIKFRSESTPSIAIEVAEKGDRWLFRVSDNGIGIDPAYSKRIFEMFQRLHHRDEFPGTGTGLALCQKIVQRHGGRIWVEGEDGRGSTFCFTIPMETELESDERRELDASQAAHRNLVG